MNLNLFKIIFKNYFKTVNLNVLNLKLVKKFFKIISIMQNWEYTKNKQGDCHNIFNVMLAKID